MSHQQTRTNTTKAITPPQRIPSIVTNSFEEILLETGLATQSELDLGRPVRDGKPDVSAFVDSQAIRTMPEEWITANKVLPILIRDIEIGVVAGQLPSPGLMRELQQSTSLKPVVILTADSALDEAIESCLTRARALGVEQNRLGDVLLERRVVTNAQLEDALEKQTSTGRRLGEILVEEGHCSDEDVYSCLAEQMGFECRKVDLVQLPHKVRRLISKRFAESHQVLPLEVDHERAEVVVATSTPQDLAVLDLLRKICRQEGLQLRLVIATPTTIAQGISYAYDPNVVLDEELEMETVSGAVSRSDLVQTSEMPKIKKILNQLLYRAVTQGASDIHIESLESRVRVRYRIDGILQERQTVIRKDNIGPVISVLKVDSDLDITERRRSQDGVFKKRIGKDWYIDFRINVHNTEHGGDAVIRILDSTKRLPSLQQLGFPPAMMARYLQLVRNPQGLMLITGPTGSGKSTTLYSTLTFLNNVQRKIVTAEDPVEYRLEGICQYQVNDGIGNTFAEYARRFLRKDPDIILIGETRDEVTADSCLRAASTGHLVFSTLHTNHSTAAIRRLKDLGADASSICDSLLAVLAQRLVRKICDKCSKSYTPDPELVSDIFGDEKPPPRLIERLRKGTGCAACENTGYKGRIGVYELWEVTRRARFSLLDGASEDELIEIAKEEGFRPIVWDAFNKIFKGITTLEEIRRVISLDQIREVARGDWSMLEQGGEDI